MQITRDDDFGGAVLNCAVRYALGRASYMPRLVMDQIRPMLPDCSDKTLWRFEQDVAEWLNCDKGWTDYDNSYGYDNFYGYDWKRFLEAVRAEMERRKEDRDA